jgi:hypothetical protein
LGLPTSAMFICFVKLILPAKITVNPFIRLRFKKDEVAMRKSLFNVKLVNFYILFTHIALHRVIFAVLYQIALHEIFYLADIAYLFNRFCTKVKKSR